MQKRDNNNCGTETSGYETRLGIALRDTQAVSVQRLLGVCPAPATASRNKNKVSQNMQRRHCTMLNKSHRTHTHTRSRLRCHVNHNKDDLLEQQCITLFLLYKKKCFFELRGMSFFPQSGSFKISCRFKSREPYAAHSGLWLVWTTFLIQPFFIWWYPQWTFDRFA
jgi:hypothetical protein